MLFSFLSNTSVLCTWQSALPISSISIFPHTCVIKYFLHDLPLLFFPSKNQWYISELFSLDLFQWFSCMTRQHCIHFTGGRNKSHCYSENTFWPSACFDMHAAPAAYAFLFSMHFSFLLRACPYFPSIAHTEPYCKSQHFHEHESQSMWSWSCTQLLITHRKAGWTILPNCTQKWNSLRGRIQNII